MQNTAVATDSCITVAKSVVALQEISSPPVMKRTNIFPPDSEIQSSCPFRFYFHARNILC